MKKEFFLVGAGGFLLWFVFNCAVYYHSNLVIYHLLCLFIAWAGMMLMGKGVLSEKFQADFRQWLGTGALFILLLYGVLIIVSGRIDFSIYDGK
jgi:hypothetical protein